MAAAIAAAAQHPSGSVHFAVKGDWGDGTPAQAAVTRRICGESRAQPFAFLLTTGDNFYPGGRASERNFWRPERCLRLLGIPWRATWGNHDVLADDTARYLGSPRRYYAFGAGPARIVVLDGNDPADPGQLAFLRAEMRAPRRAVRIVAVHQPLYTAGVHPPAERARRLWMPWLRRGGVSLVLQGHNHLYERLEAGGITFITTAGGGAQLYPCIRLLSRELEACRFAHHFLSVDVTPRQIRVRAIAPRGDRLEDVRIPVPAR